MKNILLINEDKIPPYRVPIFNYLHKYIKIAGYNLIVVSNEIQANSAHAVKFNMIKVKLSFVNLIKIITEQKVDIVIFFVGLRNLYLFPTILATKMLRKKTIHWGHGCDLNDKKSKLKKIAYSSEFLLHDAIILYAEHLKKHLHVWFADKIFIANNTLYFDIERSNMIKDKRCLARYNIKTTKNIICMGRMQKRKNIKNLLEAFSLINDVTVGLILVGPDSEGELKNIDSKNIYKLGPIYGDERLKLLSAADVYCLPGWVGLSIVDSFYCGLPFVTEEGDNAPEIMYLKDGVNGFIVPKDDIRQLAAKIQLLLKNETLRNKFSREAKREIMSNGNIDSMCKGFLKAIQFCNNA